MKIDEELITEYLLTLHAIAKYKVPIMVKHLKDLQQQKDANGSTQEHTDAVR